MVMLQLTGLCIVAELSWQFFTLLVLYCVMGFAFTFVLNSYALIHALMVEGYMP